MCLPFPHFFITPSQGSGVQPKQGSSNWNSQAHQKGWSNIDSLIPCTGRLENCIQFIFLLPGSHLAKSNFLAPYPLGGSFQEALSLQGGNTAEQLFFTASCQTPTSCHADHTAPFKKFCSVKGREPLIRAINTHISTRANSNNASSLSIVHFKTHSFCNTPVLSWRRSHCTPGSVSAMDITGVYQSLSWDTHQGWKL